ncbi:MAG: hypothetical protein ABJA86_09785 [Nocardioidaceae bacterium]
MNQPARHGPAIPPEILVRFTRAEARLYPLAIVDPEAYERGVTLTAKLLKDLRSTCADIGAVLDRRETLLKHLTETPEDDNPSPVGFSPETLVDAASALRWRELQSED